MNDMIETPLDNTMETPENEQVKHYIDSYQMSINETIDYKDKVTQYIKEYIGVEPCEVEIDNEEIHIWLDSYVEYETLKKIMDLQVKTHILSYDANTKFVLTLTEE